MRWQLVGRLLSAFESQVYGTQPHLFVYIWSVAASEWDSSQHRPYAHSLTHQLHGP